MNKLLALSALLTATAYAQGNAAPTVNLRILETSDLHAAALGYDYYQDKPTGEYGLEYTASLIKQARREAPNTLLFDNGDLIQGNPLGDYVARVQPLKAGQAHPMHKAMRLLNYDAATLGNHEFNYGLEYLNQVLAKAPMPYVNANVYNIGGKNLYRPYIIQRRVFKDATGRPQIFNVGIIGLVTPQIVQWDKDKLEGKVITKDIVETARKYIPDMKAQGADIIVALAHTGIDSGKDYQVGQENSGAELSKVNGLDVILTGHAHQEFPSNAYKDVVGADIAKGTINGKAVVMPGFWGNNLGVVDLKLQKVGQNWRIIDSKSSLRPIWDKANKKSLVSADPAIARVVHPQHEGTLDYVRGKVADLTGAPLTSYWALLQDDPSVQLVAKAQQRYVKKALEGGQYAGLPVLSAAAPFKAGGRAGPKYYTNIPVGPLAIKNAADLYVYPNTVQAVKVTGAQLREWLERSAGQFNTIDPAKTEPQPLVNTGFATYNFDVIVGLNYQIDLTQPARYDNSGTLAHPEAHRIVNLSFEGKPLDEQQEFVVATNNYRAGGGGNFPALDGSNVILRAPDETRQVLIDYLQSQQSLTPSVESNWSFKPVAGAKLLYLSSPNAKDSLPKNVTYLQTNADGFGEYLYQFEH